MEHEEAQGDAPCGSSEMEIEEENQSHESLLLFETYQAEPLWRRASSKASLSMTTHGACEMLVGCGTVEA